MARLQERRSAETRNRLIDAAIDCLYERGYAGTTTAEIAQRAGVSKGAQLHHFPAKDQLVVAALEHLFDLRVAASRDAEAMRNLPADKSKRLAAIIDSLVPVYQDRVFYAWLELVVASRTDLSLRQMVRQASERFSAQVLEIWKELFGSPSDDPARLRLLDQFVNGQFAAMALGRILTGGNGDSPGSDEVVEHLKVVGASLLRTTKRRTP
ncbi:MAG: TetR/AcrR family transcriptional regulator [Candidatus Binataceae bacterium]